VTTVTDNVARSRMDRDRAVSDMRPVQESERLAAIDIIRGVSLLGVLLINAETLYRVSLFQHILQFHTHPGRLNHLTDIALAAFVEFKAFALFSTLFGIGVAIQADRLARRGIAASSFLVRRFTALLAIGLCHMLLIWNGDILTLYAICGLILIPFLQLPTRALFCMGIALVMLEHFVAMDRLFPQVSAMDQQWRAATQVYASGGLRQIIVFRFEETRHFILPLLVSCSARVLGLMLLGIVFWRTGVIREPARHRLLLRVLLIAGGVLGGTAVFLVSLREETGRLLPIPEVLVNAASIVPLALAYLAGLLLVINPAKPNSLRNGLAAVGRTALSNYLAQSTILGILFYGYGLSYFGRLGSACVLLICLLIFAAELLLSRAWLKEFRYGPIEWVWRSVTYWRIQPLRFSPGE
jgi:uncharacterized protein